jgi:hypothetical protein
MRKTEMHLTEEDRTALKSFRSKGLHLAREVNRAHILLALDEKVREAFIVQVLGVGRTAIWRTRSAYVEKEPVICVDEKSKQLLQQTRTPIATRRVRPLKSITNIGTLARATSS